MGTLRSIEVAVGLLRDLTPDSICVELDTVVNGPTKGRGKIKKPTERMITKFCKLLRSSSDKEVAQDSAPDATSSSIGPATYEKQRGSQPSSRISGQLDDENDPSPPANLEPEPEDSEISTEVGRGHRGRDDFFDDDEGFDSDFSQDDHQGRPSSPKSSIRLRNAALDDRSVEDYSVENDETPCRPNRSSNPQLPTPQTPRRRLFDPAHSARSSCAFQVHTGTALPTPSRSISGSTVNMGSYSQPASGGGKAGVKRTLKEYLADIQTPEYAEAWVSRQDKAAALNAATLKLQTIINTSAPSPSEKPPTSSSLRSQREIKKKVRDEYIKCQDEFDVAELQYIELKEKAEKEEALRELMRQVVQAINE